MAKNVVKGLLYKKILNDDGTVKEKLPFLVKSLASLIIRDDGTTVEASLKSMDTRISSVENNKSYLIFNTYAEYKTAYDAGKIDVDTMCIVKERE